MEIDQFVYYLNLTAHVFLRIAAFTRYRLSRHVRRKYTRLFAVSGHRGTIRITSYNGRRA